MKALDDFDFGKAPQVHATKIHELAQGGYIDRAEPVILIGDTGKTHLLTGLCVAACRQKRRGFASLLPQPQSTNLSKPGNSCIFVACWSGGNNMT